MSKKYIHKNRIDYRTNKLFYNEVFKPIFGSVNQLKQEQNETTEATTVLPLHEHDDIYI